MDFVDKPTTQSALTDPEVANPNTNRKASIILDITD
jgi:hypothetical protein